MGCDIHTIVEIKKNNKWEYVPELPDTFDDRCYGVFSILNRNVRNYNGKNGFEGKGLPKDLSGTKFRFVSEREQLENSYNNKSTFVCKSEDGKYVNAHDEILRTQIDEHLFIKLSAFLNEKDKERYYLPTRDIQGTSYFVQDAQKVNGKFMDVPFKEIYKTIDKFNKAYYNFTWNEQEKDYGYYEVDFECDDFHGHSYLTLEELKSKISNTTPNKEFIVEKDFVTCLENEIGDLPETMVVKDVGDNKAKVIFEVDPDDFYPQESYNEGVAELEKLKEKYNIKSDKDLRIVFAFDS